MAVQATWNLDSTVGAALSVGMGIFRAASRSNVQPLAIIACEKFGNTVAMCQETRRKVEKAMMTPEAVPVRFLKATVGFFDDDCGSQLSQSLAGVQFLGLATALVTSIGPYESGYVLELLLKRSTSDRTLLPTARQLKDLMEAIEPRCNVCGFGDSIVGWRLFLSGNRSLGNVEEELKRCWTMGTCRPSDDGIANLVDGLRQIARIGDSKKTVLSIHVGASAPWVLAFTKWCLGTSPMIILEKDATTLLDSPQSPVLVILDSEYRYPEGFKMCVSSSLSEITDIVSHAEAMSSWHPLVSIERYGKLKLRNLGLDTGLANRALLQAVPYSINLVLRDMRFGTPPSPEHSTFLEHPLSPFSGQRDILELASRMLGVKELSEARILDEGVEIIDLSVVKLYLEEICKDCNIEHIYDKTCSSVRHFYDGLSSVIADIMALSLFSNPDSLLVNSTAAVGNYFSGFQSDVSNFIKAFNGKAQVYCKISELLQSALYLTRHVEPFADMGEWMMSSKHGQAIYLRIFATQGIDKRGYLTLEWLPGLIRYEDETYDTVRTSSYSGVTSSQMPEHLSDILVQSPVDITSYRFRWWIQKLEDYLEVGVGAHDKNINPFVRSPRTILENIAILGLVEECPHPPDAPLVEPDRCCTYTHPLEPKLELDDRPGHVSVVASAGNDQLRFLALAGDERVRFSLSASFTAHEHDYAKWQAHR